MALNLITTSQSQFVQSATANTWHTHGRIHLTINQLYAIQLIKSKAYQFTPGPSQAAVNENLRNTFE